MKSTQTQLCSQRVRNLTDSTSGNSRFYLEKWNQPKLMQQQRGREGERGIEIRWSIDVHTTVTKGLHAIITYHTQMHARKRWNHIGILNSGWIFVIILILFAFLSPFFAYFYEHSCPDDNKCLSFRSKFTISAWIMRKKLHESGNSEQKSSTCIQLCMRLWGPPSKVILDRR